MATYRGWKKHLALSAATRGQPVSYGPSPSERRGARVAPPCGPWSGVRAMLCDNVASIPGLKVEVATK